MPLNIFEHIHKTMASQVFNTCISIQQTDFAQPAQSQRCIALIGESIRFFTHHIVHSDARIYESIVHGAPYIVAMMENHDLKDMALMQTIKEKLFEYQTLSLKQSFEDFSVEIRTLFFSFATSVLQHIHRENKVIKEILSSLYKDQEVEQIHAKLLQQVSAQENCWYLEQIFSSLPDGEALLWMGGATEDNGSFQNRMPGLPHSPVTKQESVSMQRA